MTVSVLLYGSLASVAGTTATNVEASSVSGALKSLSEQYGEDFKDKLYDQSGTPRRFINIYVNGRDYRFLKKLDTELNTDDEVSLIPAVSGG
jgi:molybdopterin synthase sulfur carrier subunit